MALDDQDARALARLFLQGRARAEQLGRAHFPGPARVVAGPGHQGADVVGQVAEGRHAEAFAIGPERLGLPLRQDELRPALGPHQVGAGGGVDHRRGLGPAVGEEDLPHLAAVRDLPDEERDAVGGAQELARAQQPARGIGRDLVAPVVQPLRRRRHEMMGQHAHQPRHDQAEDQHRPRHPPGRDAAGLPDRQLAVRRHPVGHVDGGDAGRDGQRDRDQQRKPQHRELQEHRQALAVRDQPLEQPHRRVDPVDQDQHERGEAEQRQKLRQQVAVEPGQGPPPSRMPQLPAGYVTGGPG